MAASTAAVATADFIELDLRFKRAVDVRTALKAKNDKADKIVRALTGQIQALLDRAVASGNYDIDFSSDDEDYQLPPPAVAHHQNQSQGTKRTAVAHDDAAPKKRIRKRAPAAAAVQSSAISTPSLTSSSNAAVTPTLSSSSSSSSSFSAVPTPALVFAADEAAE